MKIYLIAIGNRMPRWVKEGYEIYAERFSHEITFELKEIESVKRHKKASIQHILNQEGQALIAAIPLKSRVIALDERGEQWNTLTLSKMLQKWKDQSENISLLIGGPDGLPQACLDIASHKWSLSKLTFPHPLVRIIVVEQIYRAWTLISHHPYHRN